MDYFDIFYRIMALMANILMLVYNVLPDLKLSTI
jgi:hypothetical protein